MLGSLITSKTRLKMLIKFFVNTANKGYLNGLANEFNESTNSIRKELNNLSSAGYLLKVKSNNKVIYNANKKHPLFAVLQKVVRQHLGIEDIIDSILDKIGDVRSVAIVGDYAKGKDSGVIDVVLIGDIDKKILQEHIQKAEELVSRKIRAMVMTSDEFNVYTENQKEPFLLLWSKE